MKKITFFTLALSSFFSSIAQTWVKDYSPGIIDVNGRFAGGNEIMQIVSHKGKLYAGNSYWQEFDTLANPRSCEILRKDGASSSWVVDTGLSTANLRIGAMKSFIFNTDYTGTTITPDTLLITIPNDNTGLLRCLVRNDAAYSWVGNNLATTAGDANCRALGIHKDAVNNITYVFAGLLNYGIFSGRYNPSFPGKLQWSTSSEFITPSNERVMGFTECNGVLYAATSDGGIGHIYKRTDGTATWTLIKTTTGGPTGEDLRGLSSVPNPTSVGEVLWYSWNKKAYRIDPNAGYSETMEYSYADSLTSQLGISVQYVLAAYNDNLAVYNDGSGDDVRLIGFELKYDAAALTANPKPNWNGWGIDGQYYERHQNGAAITYIRKYIVNNSLSVTDSLIATRTLCVSPFPTDSGRVLYAGGMDCNSIPMSRQAWIYKADVGTTTNIAISENSPKPISIYPNPASDIIRISFPYTCDFSCEIINMQGKVAMRVKNQKSIDVATLPRDIYFVRFIYGNNTFVTKVVIR